jgi:hypothetical protein
MKRAAFALAFALALVACRAGPGDAPNEAGLPPSTEQSAPAPEASAPPKDASPGLLPLTEAGWLERLDLPGGDRAFLSVPLGATEPRPVMVAVHGAGDRPEWACGGWRGITDAYPFIVCPDGAPSSRDKRRWSSRVAITRSVDAALPALRRRFGAHVAEGPMVYAAFSQGAHHGAWIVRERAADFPLVTLVEGGHGGTGQPGFAEQFSTGGGKRMLFACSTPGCAGLYKGPRDGLLRAGVEARIFDAGPVGHNLNGEVIAAMKAPFAWLVRDDPRWWGLPALRDASVGPTPPR